MRYTTTIKDDVTRVINCDTPDEYFFSQGYFHYKDRALQIEMLRIIGQGKLSELLIDNEETFGIDKFMRTLGIYYYADKESQQITDELLNFLNPYIDGINKAMAERIPLELKLMGYRPNTYSVTDVIATIKIMSYMGLAQGQQDLEKLIIELLKGGVDLQKIRTFFNIDEEIDDGLVEKLKKTKVYNKSLSKATKYVKSLPKVSASNNWISNIEGHVIMACDPHLEINRLPCVWYEMKATIKDLNQTFLGITMPGVPGFIMGSNKDVAFSFTYGFMDQIDYFVEEVRDSKIRIESEFIPLKKRVETINRKTHLKSEISIYETELGILETNLEGDDYISDGLYLNLCWSNHRDGGLQTLEALRKSFYTKTASDMADALSNVCISCNWLIGDSENNIIYQQSGKLPNRLRGGLLPLMGYKRANKWNGHIDPTKLTRYENPKEGLLVTANNQITFQNLEEINAINAPMGDYRKDRIEERLHESPGHHHERYKSIQHDVISLQAKSYITTFKELSDYFKDWDYSYDVASLEASAFEHFYKELFIEFFSDHFIDKTSSEFVLTQTSFVADFYNFFDQYFLDTKDDSIFFKKTSREEYVSKALEKMKGENFKAWGEINNIDMNNIFFDGKLPKFTGLDNKQAQIKGNRSTISQGSVFSAHNRKTTFCPSWRFVVDLKSLETFSQIPGGLSDRRFPSKYYQSDLVNYFSENYRKNSLQN